MDKRIRSRDWRVWVSSGIDEFGYVIDDPNRPTENQALRNLRDRAKLLSYEIMMRKHERQGMASASR